MKALPFLLAFVCRLVSLFYFLSIFGLFQFSLSSLCLFVASAFLWSLISFFLSFHIHLILKRIWLLKKEKKWLILFLHNHLRIIPLENEEQEAFLKKIISQFPQSKFTTIESIIWLCPKDTEHFLILLDDGRCPLLPKLRRQVKRQAILKFIWPRLSKKSSSQFSLTEKFCEPKRRRDFESWKKKLSVKAVCGWAARLQACYTERLWIHLNNILTQQKRAFGGLVRMIS